MQRWMVYGVFKGKHINFWRDNRTYKTQAYAKKVLRENQPFWNGELKVKPVIVHRCPECKTILKAQ